jgi:uncharacterized RDD family membrane protein YckC
MFTIIGGDGKEYGPVNTDQVHNWIKTGRANLDTKAKAAGSDEWRRIGDFAEFGGLSGVPPLVPSSVTDLSSTPEIPSSSQPLAGLGERFGAALIDGLLETLCWIPTSLAMMQAIQQQVASGSPNISELMAAMNGSAMKSVPYLVGLMGVQGVLLTVRSQSVGKILLGLRIVRYRTGEPAGFLRAFLLRGFVPGALGWIPLLGKLFWLIDVCFIFGDEHRCVHDYIGGTSVVKAKRD